MLTQSCECDMNWGNFWLRRDKDKDRTTNQILKSALARSRLKIYNRYVLNCVSLQKAFQKEIFFCTASRYAVKIKLPFNIVGIVIAPSKLHIQPEFLRGSSIHNIFIVSQKRRSWYIPLIGGKKEDVSTRWIHLVRFPWMNGLFLHCFDLKGVQFLIKHLAQVHDDRFVNFLWNYSLYVSK